MTHPEPIAGERIGDDWHNDQLSAAATADIDQVTTLIRARLEALDDPLGYAITGLLNLAGAVLADPEDVAEIVAGDPLLLTAIRGHGWIAARETFRDDRTQHARHGDPSAKPTPDELSQFIDLQLVAGSETVTLPRDVAAAAVEYLDDLTRLRVGGAS